MDHRPVYQSLKRHVHSRNDLERQGYKFGAGFQKISQIAQNPAVFAIDCEMCTSEKNGAHVQEVIRISIVDHKNRVAYDKLVKPRYPIFNFNTAVHGITQSQVNQQGVSLAEVKNYLERNFFSNTLIVGHSLEHDLRALELEHSYVVDVSLLYKRPTGQKYSLEDLAEKYLKRNVKNHDSVEDAQAAMDLALRF